MSTQTIVELDARQRAPLARIAPAGVTRFLATVDQDGTITLIPAVVMTIHDVRLLRRPELADKVRAAAETGVGMTTMSLDDL